MPWTAGDCYWAQGVNEPRPHLRVVVTKPDLSERFIVANLTSMRAGADQTTVLKPGDHQLVRHESFVLYGASRMMTVTALEKEIQQRLGVRAAPSFSGLTLKRKQTPCKTTAFLVLIDDTGIGLYIHGSRFLHQGCAPGSA
jgi:hypothetical protein